MKFAFLILLAINLVDLVVLPFLAAKCRSGAMLDKYSSWLPFEAIYKALLLAEVLLIRDISLMAIWLAAFFTLLYIINAMVLMRHLAGTSGYSVKDPVTRTMQDVLELKEHRFYPAHAFSGSFWFNVVVDNWERFAADLMFVWAFSQILYLL